MLLSYLVNRPITARVVISFDLLRRCPRQPQDRGIQIADGWSENLRDPFRTALLSDLFFLLRGLHNNENGKKEAYHTVIMQRRLPFASMEDQI